ncbi:unnamed protein product [Phytophthora fragariaefolia]|uniref:Unnamed protein product n=1 Tax=Phytophthora fragariaefolia TaxID=1490495 RepID=A0A9W7D5N0_9STRA|nr:unnamed protein product [Phytophthora fragariaefolia]
MAACDDDEEEKDDGGGGEEEAATPSAGRPAIAEAAPSSTGVAVTRGAPAGPPPPTTAAPAPIAAAPTVVYRHEPKTRRLRLPKFRGLDELKMMVKAWLREVRNEIRRQTAILKVEWYEREVFLEMVANVEGEALLWYDTVEDSLERAEDQTFGNLRQLLKDRYMVKRSNPEVVARLRQRRQQRGEPLVAYAQRLREIVSGNDVGEEWLVDAFLAGMGNTCNAALVRRNRPSTLNAAVNAAIEQVGEYGEGYGIGLGMAMTQHDRRSAAVSGAPVADTGFGRWDRGTWDLQSLDSRPRHSLPAPPRDMIWKGG